MQDFVLINPPSTRNIIGDYAIAGNTVECITDDRGLSRTNTASDYPAPNCQDSTAFNDNNYMARYIDIDSDTSTWNSSSSNIDLPVRYTNVAWAGLFWQGSINNNVSTRRWDYYLQRRAFFNGSTIDYKYITNDESLDLTTSNGNKILFKIDGSSYNQVEADTFYYDTKFNTLGGYYAAYSDVTSYVQNAALSSGIHTFTVANIVSNEGREVSYGNYAGWSLVVIYQENPIDLNSAARNISIYNGYTIIPTSETVKITGFKLPKSGPVSSQFASFAGEGEFVYTVDSMIISKNADLSNSSNMPGATDTNNIFDAQLANILRDSPNDNDVVNANGIDIDNYDLSTILTEYRDVDPNIDTVYIGLSSNNDYITPSMMAFSAELYKPKICYDYTVQRNSFDITEDNRTINTLATNDLSINIALQNLEGDFDLTNSSMALTLSPANDAAFDYALYAPNNVNTLIPAIHTSISTASYPQIAIGENVTASGGTLKSNQLYFAEFNYDLLNNFNGSFDVDFNTTIDFGSGAVPTLLSTRTNTIARCPQSSYYNPQQGTFNVERTDSLGKVDPKLKYPLYTQIVGKDFDFHVVAYDGSTTPAYTSELPLSGYTVDLELINASTFSDDNATFLCANPNPRIIQNLDVTGKNNIFVHYPLDPKLENSRVDLSSENIQTDTALRNAVFRIWYIVDENNSIIPHECASASDNTCFQTLYDTYLKETDTTVQQDGTIGFCQNCSTYNNPISGKSGCYACLRDFFSRAVCSRDNFAIRPESYRLRFNDTNESYNNPQSINLAVNDTSPQNLSLAAEYRYQLEGNATVFNSDIAAKNYNIDFNAHLQFNTSSGTCNDTDDRNISFTFDSGMILNNLSVTNNNAGNYDLHFEDTEWTKVDQNSYPYKTYKIDDCIVNNGKTSPDTVSMSGCNTVSNLYIYDNAKLYFDIDLTFEPYSFNLSSILATLPNNNDFIYVNQLDTNNLLDLNMALRLDGNVTALGKLGTPLTNFTSSCAAQPVVFDINRSVSRDGSALNEQNISSIDLLSAISTNTPIRLQRRYVDKDGNVNYSVEDPIAGLSTQFTITPTQFVQDQNGSAYLELYYNFERINNQVMNPLNVTFVSKDANSTAASSSAHLGTHLPESSSGIAINPQNIYYGRVAPSSASPYLVPRSNVSTVIPMYIEVYCNDLDLNCSQHQLNIQSPRDPDEWWINSAHVSQINNGDGNMLTITDIQGASPLTITPTSNVFLNLDSVNNKTDIGVTINASSLRPYNTTLSIVTDVWLAYNPGGLFNPIINFLGGGGWAGKGNTGNIVETTPYFDENNKRTEW